MKILLVNDYATPTGGAELIMLSLRDGLRKRGHDARLFASSAQRQGGDTLADYECFGTTSSFRTLLQTANPWAMRRLARVLAEFQPDVVHIKIFLTQLSPLILRLLQNIPSLYHAAWYRPICPLGHKTLPDGNPCHNSTGVACYRNHCLPARDWLPLMLQMHLWQRWRSAFNLVVANSAAVKDRLIAEGIEPVEVAWCGIPIRPLRPIPLMSPPTVVFAGRLVWEKGVDVLIRAFGQVVAKIPQARLLIAGDGPEIVKLQELIAGQGLSEQVSMLGHLPRAEMEQHFGQAWAQVVPSRWTEPFGMVAPEAMMRGIAVVASDSGGLREIVRNGETGFLVPPDNVACLTTVLLNLLQNRTLAEQMGMAGREVALAQFTEEIFVSRFIDLYQSIL
ncbi:glycosyltransferase family 4 protein [Chloroflexi bacterium TSY]|nr:glycosyltransferase family 4 protein [Chloroflexi bacterium TSY]MBV7338714.1 glycosyltransferase family 4 protein [Chloroflexi bacterium TSY]MBV7338721.1 glycosyltransferase family 4 protein [Chloroflexi bacterium TSY]